MLITNATLVTWGTPNQVLNDHAVFVDGGIIRAVGRSADLIAQHHDAERIDAHGQLLMPGSICAHTHFYGAYARGMSIPGAPPADFPEILRRLWWNLDKALDADSVRASALVCLVDAIKHGTTTLFDHHASPHFIEGSLDVIGEVVEQAGVRAVLCYEVTDRDGRDKTEAGLAENIRFANRVRQHPRLRGMIGLHASLTLSDETLIAVLNARADNGHDDPIHIHVAEHEADQDDCLAKYGKRVVQRLAEYELLGGGNIAAHCVHIDASELDLLVQTGMTITHQPRSNMNNAVGAMPFDRMIRAGAFVCLGNDGFSNAMWEEWKAGYLLHKATSRDPRSANGAHIAQMATRSNALLASLFFGDNIGWIGIGAAADLMLVDYQPFTPMTADNIAWHILFGFESSMVTSTMVGGRWLMRDRQLLTLDERAIARAALELAPGVWERYAAHAARGV